MEVPYHTRPYLGGIFTWAIGPIYMLDTSNQTVHEMAIEFIDDLPIINHSKPTILGFWFMPPIKILISGMVMA